MKVVIDVPTWELDWSQCKVDVDMERGEEHGASFLHFVVDYELNITLNGQPVEPVDEDEALSELLEQRGYK